jgi:hypothetical protein
MPAEIHELQMRCDRRVVKLPRLGGARARQRQRSAHAVQQRAVERGDFEVLAGVVQRAQRMIRLHDAVADLDEALRRNRARDELDSHRVIGARRQIRGSQAGPERMLVAGHHCEPGDSLLAQHVVDLRVLGVVATVRHREAGARPLRPYSIGQVGEIRAPRERAERVSPDLPRRLARAQAVDEPRALLRS